jgi:DNA polymerase III alpha subunit
VHKGKIVALIQAGAFDCFDDRDSIKRQFNSIRKDKVFDLNKSFLEDSVDAFGFILLHPFFFDKVKANLQKRYVVTSQQLGRFERWEKVRVAGVIINTEVKMSGKSAMVVKLEDHRGDMFVYLDKDAAKRFKPILKPFNLIMVDGRLMGTNRILCYAAKDKIYNITEKIATLLEDPSCRKKRLI